MPRTQARPPRQSRIGRRLVVREEESDFGRAFAHLVDLPVEHAGENPMEKLADQRHEQSKGSADQIRGDARAHLLGTGELVDGDGQEGMDQPDHGAQQPQHGGAVGKDRQQLQPALKTLKENPDSRRMMVSAWNVAEVEKMALPPCHCLFQFYVADGKLSLQLYQRSADIFLGVPFNIASYALLLQMMAQVTGLQCGDFVHTLGDAHIYLNHLEQVKLQLTREPRALPKMIINPEVKDLFSFQYEDFSLEGYDPHPHIAGVVSV